MNFIERLFKTATVQQALLDHQEVNYLSLARKSPEELTALQKGLAEAYAPVKDRYVCILIGVIVTVGISLVFPVPYLIAATAGCICFMHFNLRVRRPFKRLTKLVDAELYRQQISTRTPQESPPAS